MLLFALLQAAAEYGGLTASDVVLEIRRLADDVQSWTGEHWIQVAVGALGLVLFMKLIWDDG